MKSHRKRSAVAQNPYSSNRYLPGFLGRVWSGPHFHSVSSILSHLISWTCADKTIAVFSLRFFERTLSLDVYGLRLSGLEFSGSWSSVCFPQ